MTKKIQIGSRFIGGGEPIAVQSMTCTPTTDFEATLAQIRLLEEAGCDIVRCSVYDEDCAKAVRTIVDGSPVPVVADIHFNHRLAIAAAETAFTSCASIPATLAAKPMSVSWLLRRRCTTSRSASV